MLTQEGGVTEEMHYDWAVNCLGPVLNRWDPNNPKPNSCVCLDNVNTQHCPRFIALLKRIGVKIFHFARYDPSLSPIEKAFSQMKACLRKPGLSSVARAAPELALRVALREISAQNARGYMRCCGLDVPSHSRPHQQCYVAAALVSCVVLSLKK
jgi:hypothetical protein